MTERVALTYCSFADDKCLGVLILRGNLDPIQASLIAHAAGINPGGELLAIPVLPEHTDVPESAYQAMLENAGRLLRPDEARELLEAKPISEWEEAEDKS